METQNQIFILKSQIIIFKLFSAVQKGFKNLMEVTAVLKFRLSYGFSIRELGYIIYFKSIYI